MDANEVLSRSAMTARADVLHVESVAKRFGTVAVLRGVSLRADPGTFVVLLGPSGCGKTTLLRIIAGLERADAGAVRLGQRDLTSLPAHQRPVNTVFQSYALFPHLSVFENVAFGLRSRGIADGEVKSRTNDALELLRIGDFSKRLPHQLSGGQRQRVALARALVNEPEVLLLDEPMSALDAQLRADVQVELKRLQRRLGTTFVLVTHDQDEAMTLADRVVLMKDGAIEQEGAPASVYDRPASRFSAAFLGAANLIAGERVEEGVRTAFGVLRCPLPPTWQRGWLAIRPERIDPGEGENNIRIAITDVIYRGDHVDCYASSGGESLRLRLPPDEAPRPGDSLAVRLPADWLVPLND